MKTGILDPVSVDVKDAEFPRHGSFSGGGPHGMGSGGGPDGGGSERLELEIPNEKRIEKARLITWFLLMAVAMTFAGLFGAYVMIATNQALEWQPFDLPAAIWVSTLVIAASSVTYHFALKKFTSSAFAVSRKWLIATTVLGATFISSQLLAWTSLVERGLYLQGNPYAGFFYMLTAAHLVHVLGGIIALGTVTLMTWYPPREDEEFAYKISIFRSVGWYWHLMGALWFSIALLLAFWK